MEQPLTKVSEGPSDDIWGLYRSSIKRLYLDEDKTLPQVMEIMKRDYDFKASIKMYKRRLGLWKLDGKNLKRPEVKQIARRKVERDAVGKSSKFFIKGREVHMDNIRRYLKKQGISSLEELDQVPSPVTYNCDVVCTTPAHSPISSGNHMHEVECQDVPHDHDSDSLHCNQSCSMAHSITGRRSLSARRTSGLLHFLSLSPETRSRRLLSLSPIPRTLAVPKAFSILEQVLSTLSLYMMASFEAGIWETGTNGHLFSKKDPFSGNTLNPIDGCLSARALYKERKYVQFRQTLSHVCRGMELDIKNESPYAMPDLLFSSYLLHRADLPGVASTILSHAYSVAATYLGASHPVAQTCGALQKLDAFPHELQSRLLQCQSDHLEKELGPWHLTTVYARSDLLLALDTSEAIGRARASLASYELTGSKYDYVWFDSMIGLVKALRKDRQYENAKQICRDTLDALDESIHFSYLHSTKADLFWQLSRIAERGSSNIAEAEVYMQLAVAESDAALGSQNPATMSFKLHRAKLLRALGRFDEAGEIETQIQDILGPPEIEELLS
jgi:tetratricopeptide (TPR) repeat protein